MAFDDIGNFSNKEVEDSKNKKKKWIIYYRGREKYDIRFIIAELMVSLIIVLILICMKKIKIIDPLALVKSVILYGQIIIVVIQLLLMYNSFRFLKFKENIIKSLVIILCMAIVFLIIFFLVKIRIEYKYTYEKFEELYEIDIKNGRNTDITKEYYIKESLSDIQVFGIKVLALLLIQVLMVLINIYFLQKLIKEFQNENRLKKDDIIIYDDEINIKF